MGHKILLADDSITIQKVVELILADEGFELRITGDGQEAFKVMQEYKPDIVLADVEMPKMNGYELCKRIKTDSRLRATPVVLMVAAFDIFDEQKAAEAMADGNLPKPFGKDEFLSVIKDLLKKPSDTEQGHEEKAVEKVSGMFSSQKAAETSEEAEKEDEESELSEQEFTPEQGEPVSGNVNQDDRLLLDELSAGEESARKLEPGYRKAAEFGLSADEVQGIIRETVENMIERALPDMTGMVMESVKASVPQKEIVTAIYKEAVKESIDEIKGEEDLQFAGKIRAALLPGIPAKDEIADAVRATLAELLKDVVSDEMKEHLTKLMHETLVSSFRDIILSVAWEVIPRVATSVIEAEIKKLTSNNDDRDDYQR
ncbi:MAG TPA: response regulator [Thermodesulfovibrionia bacterium]|nr:response regulator [Thermodesulfovibrionia bacterium]